MVAISARISVPDFGALLSMTGLTVGTWYDVKRGTRLIMSFKADNTSRDRTDFLLPFGEATTYTITARAPGTGTATSAAVVLPWQPGTRDTPLWDAASAGSWPILRAIDHPDKTMKLPVADYAAEFGFRAHRQTVLGSQYVSVATDVMTAKTFTFTVLTPSPSERRRLIDLLRSGPLHLRAPCVDGLGDQAFRVLSVSESVPMRTRPLLRAWQIDAQAIAVPSGFGIMEASALQRTWADVRALGTWAQVKAVGTWLQIKTKPDAQAMADDPLLSDEGLF